MKLLKFNNSTVYFTSDTHFGHNQKFIYETRGFSSIIEHDTKIIENINSVVHTDDVLFHLGDFCLNTTQYRFEEIIDSINCKNIYYIWGNHNSRIQSVYDIGVSSKYGPGVDVYPYKYKNIIFVGPYIECIINGKFIVMSHFPMYSWNYMKNGSWCLHGHEHCAVADHLPDGNEGKILDVGWDFYKTPVAFSELESIMHRKSVKSIGHH